MRLGALTLLVDHLFYLTSALIQSYILLKCKMLIYYNSLAGIFVWFLGMIFCPLRPKLRGLAICFEWDLNINISVLLTFSNILLALNHWTKLERSWVIFSFISVKEELTYEILVSSAEWCTDENIIAFLRLLIYIRNSRGPNIEPWGTLNTWKFRLFVVNCCKLLPVS